MPKTLPRFLLSTVIPILVAGSLSLQAQSPDGSQCIKQVWRFMDTEAGLAMAAMRAADRPSWWPDHVACSGMVVDFWGGGTYVLAGYEANGRASLVAIQAPSSLNFFQALEVLSRNEGEPSERMEPELPVRWEKRELPRATVNSVVQAFLSKAKDPRYDNLMGPFALDPVTFIAAVPEKKLGCVFSAGADAFLLGDPEALKVIPDARVQTAWGLGVLEDAADWRNASGWSWAGSTGRHLKAFALNFAVETHDRSAIKQLLADGADPNVRPSRYPPGTPDWEACSPLDLAAGDLDVESVKLLLERGANAKGNDIYRPLDQAVLAGGYARRGVPSFPKRAVCLEIVQTLLAGGADPKKAMDVFQEGDDLQRDPVVLKALQMAAAKTAN